MTLIDMVKCDNPKCHEVGYPEHVDEEGHAAPYGWITGQLALMGPTTFLKIEVHHADCLQPAWEYLLREYHRGEFDDD